jgi:hypothetical protein
MEGEYTLTVPKRHRGARFADVIYVYGGLLWQAEKKVPFAWMDVRSRILIGRNVDGVIAVGRSVFATPCFAYAKAR